MTPDKRRGLADSSGSHESQHSSIIAKGGHSAEFPGSTEDGRTKRPGVVFGGVAKDLFYTHQPELLAIEVIGEEP